MLGREKSSGSVYAIKLLRKDVILAKVRKSRCLAPPDNNKTFTITQAKTVTFLIHHNFKKIRPDRQNGEV